MSSWRRAALGLAALILPGCLAIEEVLVGWFGPEHVTLREAYDRDGKDFRHAAFTAVLRSVVTDDGLVDYPKLLRDPSGLDAYLAALATVELDLLSRDARLATEINAYNAFTLRLILDHFPLESIQDIPAEDRWDKKRWTLGGETLSLAALEHERLRPRYKEPRIHFAINCASIGCPPLWPEAYETNQLEAQLERAARRAHDPEHRWFELRGGTVRLTRLYLWYKPDFLQVAPSVLEFAARFHAPLATRLESGARPSVDYLPYDWGLNVVGAELLSE